MCINEKFVLLTHNTQSGGKKRKNKTGVVLRIDQNLGWNIKKGIKK